MEKINPCEGCAFTKGAAANLEPQNAIKSQFCVLGGLPFYCHHDDTGAIRDMKELRKGDLRRAVQNGDTHICAGWKREVKELSATGYYRIALQTKRAFAMFGLGALQIFTSTKSKAKKERAARNLKDVILALNKARGFSEVVD
jgi:hypothetical protein